MHMHVGSLFIIIYSADTNSINVKQHSSLSLPCPSCVVVTTHTHTPTLICCCSSCVFKVKEYNAHNAVSAQHSNDVYCARRLCACVRVVVPRLQRRGVSTVPIRVPCGCVCARGRNRSYSVVHYGPPGVFPQSPYSFNFMVSSDSSGGASVYHHIRRVCTTRGSRCVCVNEQKI